MTLEPRFRPVLPLAACILSMLTWSSAGTQEVRSEERPPNVVLFLVDDLGWADVGSYGSQVYRTPRIDELARRGVRLTNAYASHPMCVASRYSLMSGRYAARKRSNSETPATKFKDGTTLAEAFRSAGYTTFFAGKWHVEKRAGASPESYGFDVQVGVHGKGGVATHFFPYGEDGDPRKVPLEAGGKPGEYLTDRLTDETISFVEANRSKPFFVYLSHYAVHKPLEAKGDLVAEYARTIEATEFSGPPYVQVGKARQKQHQDDPVYAAMVQSVDESLGRIVDALQELGLTERTIVVFTSDNGGSSCNAGSGEHESTSNLPLKAGKFWLYEGGIRVPLVVAYPKGVASGKTSDAVVVGTDHYPTLLELAGLDPRPEDHLDGVSYAAAIRGDDDWRRAAAFWHFPIDGPLARFVGTSPGSAIRDGNYKLIEWYESGVVELYNMSEDIGEQHDLQKREPARARELLSRLRRWRAEVDAPL
jgi:arylsulfatase A-like enzyme